MKLSNLVFQAVKNVKYLEDFSRYADMGSIEFLDDIDFNDCIFVNKKRCD